MAKSRTLVTLTGQRELRAAIDRARRLFPEQLFEAVQTTTHQVKAGARSRVPVRSGALKSKIAARTSRKTLSGTVFIAPGKVGDEEPRRYHHLVELGTRRVPARPYLFPAAEAERGSHVQRLRAAGRHVERALAVSRFG